MIRVGIIGSTGYAGSELVRLLLQRSDVEIVWYGSHSYIGKKYADVYRHFFKLVDAECLEDNLEELIAQVDVVFTATPQGLCAELISENVLQKIKVIDLSADFRIKDVKTYEHWYGIEHKSPQFIEEAVYGLCEINREKVKNARLIANPGCYPTCSILSIQPALKAGLINPSSIIIDAKSGTTGAGRGAKVQNLYCEVNESIKAYGVTNHRHTPEIEEQLGYIAGQDIRLNFVMEKLGLESLISVFENYHMSFNDVLFLTKDDLNELGFKIFQKNRLISFIEDYTSKAKNYTLDEIKEFFEENNIYNITGNQE